METKIKSRCYGENIDIDSIEVKEFWQKRAENKELNAVLLGNQKDNKDGILRNENEQKLLFALLEKTSEISILDIGCGMGRWADNFDKTCDYTGIDLCDNFIKANKERFSDYPNMKFYVMKADELDLNILNKTYDLVIINGVLMYINDNDLGKVFESLAAMSPKNIYLQETISVINERLTLDKFYSEELDTNYSAIYRTPEDYQSYINKYLTDYKVVESNLFLDNKTGARKETNAQYWFLKG